MVQKQGQDKYTISPPLEQRAIMDRIKKRRQNTRLKQKFGINHDQYMLMLHEQKNVCAICEKPEPVESRSLSVDHDHSNGRIRGLLCSNCNPGIGKFKESIDLLKKAIAYLEREYTIPEAEETHRDIPRLDRKHWRRLVKTPDGWFASSIEAGKFYNVHESTIWSWLGLNEQKPHLKKEGFSSEKMFISGNELQGIIKNGKT